MMGLQLLFQGALHLHPAPSSTISHCSMILRHMVVQRWSRTYLHCQVHLGLSTKEPCGSYCSISNESVQFRPTPRTLLFLCQDGSTGEPVLKPRGIFPSKIPTCLERSLGTSIQFSLSPEDEPRGSSFHIREFTGLRPLSGQSYKDKPCHCEYHLHIPNL